MKNVPISIGPGCQDYVSPPIAGGRGVSQNWVRISLADDPVADHFPWAGSADQFRQC